MLTTKYYSMKPSAFTNLINKQYTLMGERQNDLLNQANAAGLMKGGDLQQPPPADPNAAGGTAQNNPADATAPAPEGEAGSAEGEVKDVPPEGYVNLVRLLVKALSINVPEDQLDDIFSTEVVAENAVEVVDKIENIINLNKNTGENNSRLDNPKLKKFADTINEVNMMPRLKQIAKAMKKYSPSIDFKT